MKVLITGISGSGGSYLAEYIAGLGHEVHGLSRWHSTTSHRNLEAIKDKITLHECDLADFGSVLRSLTAVGPDLIFHLASHANVRASFDTPGAVIQNNVMGTVNLFEAVRASNLRPRIVHCSTSEVYGEVRPDEVPIKETNPIRASSPYAVSKVAQDLLAYTYWKAYGIPIIRTRMFTYLNPRRSDLFATSFARQIARTELGLQDEILHGNLDSVRTVLDVRDAVRAYWMAALDGQPGEVYNIGGEKSVKVGDVLEGLRRAGRCYPGTRLDPALLRPSDVTLQIPDCSKFIQATGWKPIYSFHDSMAFLLEECRKSVAVVPAG